MRSLNAKRAQSGPGAGCTSSSTSSRTTSLPSIAEILSESRKFGLHLTMAQQYLGQRMDTEFRRGILANTQIKMTV